MNATPPTTQPDDPEGEQADTLAPIRPPSFAPLKPQRPQGMTFTPIRPTPSCRQPFA